MKKRRVIKLLRKANQRLQERLTKIENEYESLEYLTSERLVLGGTLSDMAVYFNKHTGRVRHTYEPNGERHRKREGKYEIDVTTGIVRPKGKNAPIDEVPSNFDHKEHRVELKEDPQKIKEAQIPIRMSLELGEHELPTGRLSFLRDKS